MNRRGFLSGVLALAAAPAIVRAESIMRVKPVILPAWMEAEANYIDGNGLITAPNAINGWIRKVTFYPNRRLSDAELIRLTSY